MGEGEADEVGGDDASRTATKTGDDSDSVLRAGLLPRISSRSDEGAVDIEVYVVTGHHGGIRIPENFCRECHIFARQAEAAAERIEVDVNVRVLSWWTHFPWALLRGGYHPPVMVVGGSKLCQGHDIPTPDEVIAAIESADDG